MFQQVLIMTITDFFKEALAPHVKNIEAILSREYPELDIFSEIEIIENGKAIEVHFKKLPAAAKDKILPILNDRKRFFSFAVTTIG